MKIRVLSDLHIEFNGAFDYTYQGEDVVVLAGDISQYTWQVESLVNYIIASSGCHVIFVPGNHEYYDNVFEETNEFYLNMQREIENFHFMNNDYYSLNGVLFYGGTMFTDFELDIGVEKRNEVDQIFMSRFIERSISDFHAIKRVSGRFWTAADHLNENETFLDNLQAYKDINNSLPTLDERKLVVISHFVPTPNHVHPRFRDLSTNPYFTMDAREHFEGVSLWIHGHTHDSFDTVDMVHGTHVVCNPKGYRGENPYFNPNKIVEI